MVALVLGPPASKARVIGAETARKIGAAMLIRMCWAATTRKILS